MTTRHHLAVSLLLAALIAVVVTAFVWPTSHVRPRSVPVAVAGPPDFAASVSEALAQGHSAFSVRVTPTVADAKHLLDDNSVDGVFVPGAAHGQDDDQQGVQVVLAAGGRPAVAQLLTQVATQIDEQRAHRGPIAAVQIGPAPGDVRAAVLTAAALPVVIASIAAAVAVATTGQHRRLLRLGQIIVTASVAGALLALIMDNWLGAIGGNWLAEAGCYALGVSAIVSAIAGLHHLYGKGGLVLGVAGIMLVGNPLSGATSAPDMLPSGWSVLGTALPPGALTSAIRAVGFYNGADAGGPLVVLFAWTGVGLLMLSAPRMVRPSSGHAADIIGGRPTDIDPAVQQGDVADLVPGNRDPLVTVGSGPHPRS